MHDAKMTMKAGRCFQALALLGALVLLATTLAGCTAAGTATASQLQPTAADRAASWDREAALVMIVGTEGTIQMQSMLGAYGVDSMDSPAIEEAAEQDFWSRVQDDPEPGDGRAEFWLYVYRNGAGDGHLIIVVDKDRDVIYTQEANGSDLGAPIGAYNVDSHQAVAIALEANEHLAQAMQTDHFGFVIGLFRQDVGSEATWIVAGGGGGTQGGGGGMVMVDARNGAVLKSEGGSGGPSGWSG